MERRILISLVVAISLFATFAVGNVAAAVAPLSEQELSLLNHLNAERMNHGMAPLELDPALLELARGRCFDMAHRNYFSHVTPDGTTVFDQMNAWRFLTAWLARTYLWVTMTRSGSLGPCTAPATEEHAKPASKGRRGFGYRHRAPLLRAGLRQYELTERVGT